MSTFEEEEILRLGKKVTDLQGANALLERQNEVKDDEIERLRKEPLIDIIDGDKTSSVSVGQFDDLTDGSAKVKLESELAAAKAQVKEAQLAFKEAVAINEQLQSQIDALRVEDEDPTLSEALAGLEAAEMHRAELESENGKLRQNAAELKIDKAALASEIQDLTEKIYQEEMAKP